MAITAATNGATRQPGQYFSMARIEPETMRSCLLEALRRSPQTQFENLKYEVAEVAAERGLIPADSSGSQRLPSADWRRMREGLWGLVAEGVCVPGSNESNEGWPLISLTEYGEEVANSRGPVPHDPSGYLAALEAQAPLDVIERGYLVQAVEAHNRGLPDAAAVMLGAAAEHLVESLVAAIGAADPGAKAGADAALEGTALRAHRYALAYLTDREAKLSRKLRETLPTTFGSVASLIRSARNDAGHPSLPQVSRDESLLNHQLFPRLREWVLAAIGDLQP